MNKQIEALKLVIDFLNREGFIEEHEIQNVIETCKEALAEAEKQEPYAWEINHLDATSPPPYIVKHNPFYKNDSNTKVTPLYTHPAPAEKQEPVAEVYETEDGWEKVYIGTMLVQGIPNGTKLYTHPATWQSLSDDEIQNELKNMWDKGLIPSYSIVAFARAIEKLLKEKNAPNN
jgi:hypothetical protein